MSAARPGRTDDVTAALRGHIVDHFEAADLGFLGLHHAGATGLL